MDNKEKQEILARAKTFFATHIAGAHAKNTEKCARLKAFKINPFTVHYLAAFAFGDESAESLAKALVYPRVLGTSISTTFGMRSQTFCHEVLSGYASVVSGIDIEFDDTLDGRRKYCQVKAGPQTINKDDVATIDTHFTAIKNLARQNHLSTLNPLTDCIVGVLYGTHDDISANYKAIEKNYPVIVGADFWLRLTGDSNFYYDLIAAFAECADNYKQTDLLDKTIEALAEDIKKHPEILPSK